VNIRTVFRLALLSLLVVCFRGSADAQTLVGFAKLAADTFAPGPTSGQLIAPANSRVPPFVDKQPIQGFSNVLRAANGDFLAMPDNGYGAKENSSDYVLRVYRIAPDFRTTTGGSGSIAVKSFITLRDPDHKIGFTIVADQATYPGSAIPVDAAIRDNRWLTGGDFDIESLREAHDGTLWFGDEFGPFLIHTDATGRVLEAPYPLPGVQSPQNPFLGGGQPNLPRSKGFEGMAISLDGQRLYPMLEGPLTTDSDQRRLIINEFDIRRREYTGRQWFYRLEQPTSTGQSIGDFNAVSDGLYIVIERDNFEGPAALFKKLYAVSLDVTDADGFLAKQEIGDLLHISDPGNLAGFGNVFRFPFQTIESVIPLSQNELGVLNDNNYPFSAGRVAGQPDPDEFIVIRLDRPLVQYGKLLR